METEAKQKYGRQELARRLLRVEVGDCVSSLISEMCQAHYRHDAFPDWEEEIRDLDECIDYDEAGLQHIYECCDLDGLEELADYAGSWDDAVEETGWNDAGVEDDFADYFQALKEAGAEGPVLAILHEYVIKHVSDWKKFGEDFDVDIADHRYQTNEHWIVSDWLTSKLREQGSTVVEFLGLNIYCRYGGGQSMALDHNMQRIAIQTWPDEYNGEEW